MLQLHLQVEIQSFRRQLGTARGFPLPLIGTLSVVQKSGLSVRIALKQRLPYYMQKPHAYALPNQAAFTFIGAAPAFSPKHWTRTSAHPLSRSSPPISTHHTPGSFIPATITPFSLSFSFQSGKKVPLSSSYIFHTSHRPAQTPCPLLSVICIYQQATLFMS